MSTADTIVWKNRPLGLRAISTGYVLYVSEGSDRADAPEAVVYAERYAWKGKSSRFRMESWRWACTCGKSGDVTGIQRDAEYSARRHARSHRDQGEAAAAVLRYVRWDDDGIRSWPFSAAQSGEKAA